MEKVIKIEKKGYFSVIPESGANNEEKSTIELPSLEGDTQIYLGQTIVTLVRLAIENDDCYSTKMQHEFKVDLMASILEELNVSTSEIENVYRERAEVEE